MGTLFGIDGELLERQYRNHLSGYLKWDQLPHAEEWILFEKNIGAYVGIDEVCLSRGELLERQYRNHLSGYLKWDQLPHAEEWILFEKNIGAYVGIDEVCLSRGELYTILINKEKRGTAGSIIAINKRY